ncbi:hypothetical protein LTR56_012225 [Elasticomyces elasticus]|nr:hypothetical protein LTR56_012225 [Elasticomyces elasticus]KAK3653026.1 hypothetical protein LTR22_011414 [Elasticomyces elasticus]KAK4919576.1 hypothetical protein LTR49_012796 [Elasticomyces elasticus]KAK5763116.1 hypothetical protein LTS12_006705 [Elasticomyces elasticus]
MVLIDPYDVGVSAAHFLAQEDTAEHNQVRYVLNGPEDVTGEQITALVEKHISATVGEVRYNDISFVDYIADQQTSESKNVLRSIRYAAIPMWEGKAKADTTSKEVLRLYAPKRTMAEVFEAMVRE